MAGIMTIAVRVTYLAQNVVIPAEAGIQVFGIGVSWRTCRSRFGADAWFQRYYDTELKGIMDRPRQSARQSGVASAYRGERHRNTGL